ncbi:MAG: hypothetical protein J6A01_06945 [Proteobacteria bacterium]|nr:hypothetical protein [Pseudomonadota bacterium]
MKPFNLLAYAVFIAFLCIAPIFAFAQDTVGRLIDLPNVENDDSALSMTHAITEALGNAGHVTFSESEMNSTALNSGMRAGYWSSNEDIAKLNEKIRHDALVKLSYQKKGKKASIVVTIINAYTGEVMAELERSLKKKKGKLTKDDTKAIIRGINQVTAEIIPKEYATEIVIKITSTPPGASVIREGVTLGVTPYEYKTQSKDGTENWIITYPDREAIMKVISFVDSGSYEVVFPEPVDLPSDDTGRYGAVKGGTGRPIFLLGFNVSPTIRSLDSSAKLGRPTSYTTQVFPVYGFDFDFFPFGIGVNSDYLQGLGLTASFGFGFLQSDMRIEKELSTQHACKAKGDVITCDTTYWRFNADLVYRLLLQKRGDKLNPDGLALDFFAGFMMAQYTIKTNPTYLGHDYTGVNAGLRFSTPLGLRQFRMDIGAAADISIKQPQIQKLAKWGSMVKSSWGLTVDAHFKYDIYKGFFVRAGYALTYMNTQFGGTGCLDKQCTAPSDAKSTDLYHEIQLGLGYMLY